MSAPAAFANFAVLGIALTTIIACPVVWAGVVRRMANGQEVIPFEARRRAPWVLQFAIILAACLMFVLFFSAYTRLVRHGLDDAAAVGDVEVVQEAIALDKPAAEDIALGGLGAEIVILFVLAGVLGVLHVSSGATLADFGIDFRKANYDITLGVSAFAAVSLPTYALQALLHLYVMKASHPVTEALANNRTPTLFLAMFGLAVFLAPLAEELIFRVLLQSWIEALLVPRTTPDTTTTDGADALSIQPPAGAMETAIDRPAPISTDAQSADTFRLEPEIAEPLITQRISWLPIVVTSTLFALAHLGNGPSAVPLFFFGLALGYLYQQTHRLLPSLILHMSLNGFTMLMVLAAPVPN